MIWVIKTRYSIGLWLHDPNNDTKLHLKKAWVIEFCKYEEAINYVKQEAKDKITNFMPNRLYKIKSDAVYVVFYNRKNVAFLEMENVEMFVQKYNIGWIYYRKKWRLTYKEAVSMVVGLGAVTGRNEIFERTVPICGKLYRR